MIFTEYLARALERTGHAVKWNQSSIFIESLELEIEGQAIETFRSQYSCVSEIQIKATHNQLFPGGILDCLPGYGNTEGEAFSDAASVWTGGVFQPVHELLVSRDTPGFHVTKVDSAFISPETGEELPRRIYLGPLQYCGDFAKRNQKPDEEVILKKMSNTLAEATSYYLKELYWIKTFVAKLPDDSIHASCWLNNHDWEGGLTILRQFAQEWGRVDSYTMMKQFIVSQHCQWHELKNPEKTRQNLEHIKLVETDIQAYLSEFNIFD